VNVEAARKLVNAKMTEDELAKKIYDYAKMRGWLFAHFRPARTAKGWRTVMMGDTGFPDIVLARAAPGRSGRIVFAELKREGQEPRPDQVRWSQRLDTGDSEVYLWRPSDWPRIESVLL
jgi:hypothetical protein